jgi:Ulp1 family protease
VRRIVVPVHLPCHWVTADIDVRGKVVTVYDSMANVNEEVRIAPGG